MKKKTKRTIKLLSYICLISAILPSNLNSVSAKAYIVSDYVVHVDRLDLSNGRIAGEKAQYYFNLPAEWRDGVIAEREIGSSGSFIVEKINFSCMSLTGIYKPQILFSLYVIDREQWNDTMPYDIVLKGKEHIFAVKFGISGFEKSVDISFYEMKMQVLRDVNSIKACIELPESAKDEYRDTVFVNGVPMENKILCINDVFYIQLRETCEAFGYQVDWFADNNTVKLTQGVFSDTFAIHGDMIADFRGFQMRMVNGRTYVTTRYFYQVLRKNIEVEKNNNIKLYSY